MEKTSPLLSAVWARMKNTVVPVQAQNSVLKTTVQIATIGEGTLSLLVVPT